MSTAEREFDLVLWGATGFTGQLVAEYLVGRYDSQELDLAIAGRNEGKLNSLRDELLDRGDEWETLPVLIGDAFNRESLDEIAEQTDVICSTVGPYAVYGTNLVEACIEHGTDYCDLTGEIQWIRRMIDENHEAARENSTRIVHSCGFDSVPSDIGTLMVQEHANDNYGTYCNKVKAFASSSSFSLSGGTMASMVKTFEDAAEDPEVRKILMAPYSLNPPGERDGPDGTMQKGPGYDEDIEKWTAPFMMAIANEKVVRRSNALFDYAWGNDFQYSEAMPVGSGLTGPFKATAISGGFLASNLAMGVTPIRKFLERYVLPESGEGPDRETIENSSFELRLIGKGSNPETGDEFTVNGRITGSRDPGYGSTAWMLGESAVCLAFDETDTQLDGGILTPASGIGLPLVERLRTTGLSLEVTSEASQGS